MLIGYDGEASGGVDSTTASGCLGRGERALGKPVRIQDVLVVCAADDVRILELRINESLWRAKRWLDGRGLKIAPEKTEALLVMDSRNPDTSDFSENFYLKRKAENSYSKLHILHRIFHWGIIIDCKIIIQI